MILSRFSASRLPWQLVVSSKIFKTAVVRNLLKRRARSVLRPLAPKIKKPIVIHFLPGSDKTPFADLAAEIREKLKKTQA